MDDHTLLETIQMAIKLSKLEQYPVGSIYTSTKPTDPHELFGGTWEPIQDTFLWCAGPKHAAGTNGGEEKVTLTVSEMPEHYHSFTASPYLWSERDETSDEVISPNTGTAKAVSKTTASVGGSKPHNNMPPFVSVYAWKRVK